jgi:MoxR-like ATPase
MPSTLPDSSLDLQPQPSTESILLSIATDIQSVAKRTAAVIDQVQGVIIGKREVIELTMVAMLSGGHILVEDIPGVGKTTLAKTLAKALGCSVKRVQFTPDLLPADITGTSIFNQRTSTFEFREGPVFANIVIADEINRATPKTQSSLLECMEEGQVTADGTTYELPRPFMVIATENNIESQGTYPLPEAQLDRFMIRMHVGYPSRADESKILTQRGKSEALDNVKPVLDSSEIQALQEQVRDVYVDEALRDYVVDIVTATRVHKSVTLGASPRASLALLHSGQAYAALQGRTYVLPDDIKKMAVPVLAHRIILRSDARFDTDAAQKIISECVNSVAVPITD